MVLALICYLSMHWKKFGSTCPESKSKHGLVQGIFKAEVWDDLQVVGGMESISYDTGKRNGITVPVQVIVNRPYERQQ